MMILRPADDLGEVSVSTSSALISMQAILVFVRSGSDHQQSSKLLLVGVSEVPRRSGGLVVWVCSSVLS